MSIEERAKNDARNATSSRVPAWVDALPDDLFERYITAFEEVWNGLTR